MLLPGAVSHGLRVTGSVLVGVLVGCYLVLSLVPRSVALRSGTQPRGPVLMNGPVSWRHTWTLCAGEAGTFVQGFVLAALCSLVPLVTGSRVAPPCPYPPGSVRPEVIQLDVCTYGFLPHCRLLSAEMSSDVT